MATAIKVENVSKLYRLGQIGTGTVSQDLNRWWTTKVMGKEDPFLKIGESNDRTSKGESDIVYSLRDINFDIEQGDAVGIIGRNGAGKSTLLKILSRVTSPTTGRINIKGRVASLLEVGTGFHPELTGKENIYLNGAILGMRKKEITRKLDEIIAFSGVERYIDTPVKRYSSGMYVRLAFAVAAHLESEILIVDEVLAVGDAEFQKKCLVKMGEVSKGEGRTFLFVSHNMAAVKELCSKGIFLKNGKVEMTGPSNILVNKYLENPIKKISANDLVNDEKSRRGNGEIRIVDVIINNGETNLDPTKEINFNIKLKFFKEVDELHFAFLVRGPQNSEPITTSGHKKIDLQNKKNINELSFTYKISPNSFRTGVFPIYLWIGKLTDMAGDNYTYDVLDSVFYFNLVSDKPTIELGYNSANPVGYFNISSSITEVNIN